MSPSEKILDAVAMASIRRPLWVLGAAVLVTAASFIILPRARVTSDVLSLLPDDLEEARTFREAEGPFEESNLLLVLLTAPGTDVDDDPLAALSAFADGMAERLEGSGLVARVEHRPAAGLERFLDEVFSRSFVRYLPAERVEELIAALSDDEIRRRVEASRAVLRASPVGSLRVRYDPLGLWEIVAEDLGGGSDTYRMDVESGYLATPDHRNLIILVHGTAPPANLDYGRRLLAEIEAAETATRADLADDPGGAAVEVRYTGGYVMALGDERTIRRDLMVTIITSMVGVHVIFILAFRRLRSIIFVGLPLTLGILWTFAAYVLVAGAQIVSGTAAFSAILVGLGIDFAIHALHRIEEEIERGAAPEEAIRRAVVRTGQANLAAGLTTASAFAAFLVTRIPGIAQTGLFAGMGILICLVSMTTVMPALIRLLGVHRREGAMPGFGLPRLARSLQRRPVHYLLAGGLLTAAVVAAGVPRLGALEFETDARRLRPEGDPTAETLARVEEGFGGAFSAVRLVVRGADEEEALREVEAIEPALRALVDDEVIASYVSPAGVLPSAERQETAEALLHERLPPGRIEAIRRALAESGYRPEAFEDGLERLRVALEEARPVTRERLEAAGLGPLLERHLRPTPDGVFAVIHLFPKANLWDGPAREGWVADVERRIPREQGELTGLVLLAQVLGRIVREDFVRATLLAILAILVITGLTFRQPGDVGLAVLPVILGATWMLLGMAVLGIRLNYMNIAIFPLVFGLGVDDGIHLVHRHREGGGDLQPILAGTGRAILLTSLTTLVGFGSLVLAEHRGIASLGKISLLGIATCLGTSLFILPPLMALRGRRGTAGGAGR